MRATYKFDRYLKVSEQNADGSRNTIGMAKAAEPLFSEKSPKPFFLYLATNDPHRAHEQNSLGDNTFGNKSDNQGLALKRLDYHPDEVEVPDYLPDIPETRRELAEYYQSVGRVDDTMGELVRLLKAAGQYENTVIIYLSDNGTAMPGAKTTVYEPGIRLPLVIKPHKTDKAQADQKTQAMVSWVDITPTILDLAQVPYQTTDFNGKSFKSVLSEPEKDHQRDVIYASHTFHEITMYYPMRVVRTRDFKLIWNIAHGLQYPFASDLQISSTWQGAIERKLMKFGQRSFKDYLFRPEFELYDMREDSKNYGEHVNLADHPDYQTIKHRLMMQLQAYQSETNDPWVYKWQYQ